MSKMDAKTLEALKASIAKWERNAVAETPDDYLAGPGDCPLCALFHRNECAGCPIAEAVEDTYCSSTPYGSADMAHWLWERQGGSAASAHAAVRKEVAFLKSLLPEGAS